ncbi:MAG: hypothetical protein M3256_25305 [Actinomycetota bacterium]|nr:hypothetical protein [Actinomycetota bacterium]
MLDQAGRLDILRRLLDPSVGCLEHRVAAMMLVLLGQPFTRIAAIALSDVVVDGEEVSVRLGEGFVPVPPPFAGMVTEKAEKPRSLSASQGVAFWSSTVWRVVRAGRRGYLPLRPTDGTLSFGLVCSWA